MIGFFSKVGYFSFITIIIMNLLPLVSLPSRIGVETAVAQSSDLLNQGQSLDKTGNYSNSNSNSSSISNGSYSLLSSLSSSTSAFLNNNTINNNTNSKPISQEDYDKLKNCNTDTSLRPSSIEYLTYFNCGHVHASSFPDGNQQVTREFTLIAEENQSIPIADNGLKFEDAWTFNGTIPGPTMRVTEGDIVKINLVNSIENNHSHSLHLHSIHPSDMDGIEGQGGTIAPGQNYTYTFVAQPHGVYPYHCHVTPIDQHINKGLYGVFIIDPKVPRPFMNEMVMLMNGYDLDYEKEGVGPNRIPTPEEVIEDYMPQAFEHVNEVYTVNGKAFDYANHPILLQDHVPYRVYLVNMVEFDLVNNFHLHANMFKYYPSGTSVTPAFVNDIVALTQGDRGILEFRYDLPGKYMFHAHINEFSDLGWMGFFDVRE
jgi:FtsP/CotA-like multicopper oxidase with cupredoxin domain